eukprot:CAMPEP_0172475438 /NCGR_PEP_ID=MMETSP1065-20121228/69870_1 /TAXON_ID=265537 /ORGANISM="Amphiprora paludosa, Strain CCMP125" /LENGTH=932 /DNA_ID=CAMNT_0013233641 /DNA_START=1 /DNA_END=2795 /DNA_ORIENTATION=-
MLRARGIHVQSGSGYGRSADESKNAKKNRSLQQRRLQRMVQQNSGAAGLTLVCLIVSLSWILLAGRSVPEKSESVASSVSSSLLAKAGGAAAGPRLHSERFIKKKNWRHGAHDMSQDVKEERPIVASPNRHVQRHAEEDEKEHHARRMRHNRHFDEDEDEAQENHLNRRNLQKMHAQEDEDEQEEQIEKKHPNVRHPHGQEDYHQDGNGHVWGREHEGIHKSQRKFGMDPRDKNCDMKSVRESDEEGLAQCVDSFPFLIATEPEDGWIDGIDFFFDRPKNKIREHCYIRCVEIILNKDEEDVTSEWLIDAVKLGLPTLVETLLTHPDLDLDPLESPGFGALNAVQEAIRGGFAVILKMLTKGNYDVVIDQHGRTVKDYINMKASPIVPADARRILGLSVKLPEEHKGEQRQASQVHRNDFKSGWSQETSYHFDDSKCDIDVLYSITREDFFKDYFLPGRPFVLKNFVPHEEIAAFTKDRWDSTEEFDVHKRNWKVGPTAYPSITDQEYCDKKMTILELEDSKECDDMPGVPMEVAWHPSEEDFTDLWPMYEGEELFKKSGWRNMEEFFGPRGEHAEKLAWQVFFGGDGSGATYHWHGPAFNNLYAGTKQWRIAPPLYKGFTGMPARHAQKYLDEKETSIVMGCVQHAGDTMYIPENWGHSTLTHGFTIGSAVIMPQNYHKPLEIPFMFVHINKTGGTSIIDKFHKQCDSEYYEESWGDDHRTFHTTAHSYINRYGRAVWDKAYTFTVVRHPLARQVSNFFFLAGQCERNPKVCRDRLIPQNVRGDGMFELSDKDKIGAFHQWVSDLYEEYPPTSKQHYYFGSKTQGNDENPEFNATQTSWLVDENDKIVVKEIIQLEHLDDSMHILTKNIPCLLGEDQSPGSHPKGVEFSHKNKTPKYPDWKLFAKNKKTRRIINEVYEVDFKNFGYDMPSA